MRWEPGTTCTYTVKFSEARRERDRLVDISDEHLLHTTVLESTEGLATIKTGTEPIRYDSRITEIAGGRVIDHATRSEPRTATWKVDTRNMFYMTSAGHFTGPSGEFVVPVALIPLVLFLPIMPEGPIRVGQSWEAPVFIVDLDPGAGKGSLLRIPIAMKLEAMAGEATRLARISYGCRLRRKFANDLGEEELVLDGMIDFAADAGVLIRKSERLTYHLRRFRMVDDRRELFESFDTDKSISADRRP